MIKLVNELLMEAVKLQTSDVHIEPQENGMRVRFRLDGMLRIQPTPPEIAQFYSAIVTRLKIMAHLNIAEKRLPQDGRIKLRVSGREVDVRVSIIPMLHGEGVVMRLLDKAQNDIRPAQRGDAAQRDEDLSTADRSAARHYSGHRPHRQR
ncbi:MAG UNVERIFIED_CONTAM: Flp pilus assembly complex ATPase component TadA [Planctomycetaceae bacterium]